MEIIVTSRYGLANRGHHSARTEGGGEWAACDADGNLVIDRPGTWLLHCRDGFGRTARAVVVVRGDGTYRISGDTEDFRVIH